MPAALSFSQPSYNPGATITATVNYSPGPAAVSMSDTGNLTWIPGINTGSTAVLRAVAASRTMYDAAVTSVTAIPASAQLVAAGPAWTAADIARFPQAVVIKIATAVTDVTADVLDVETKYVWPPAAAIPWVQARQERGFHGTLYLWEGNLATMQAALATVTLARPVLYWLADQTGIPHSLPNTVATQWCSYTNGPIPNVDFSAVTDSRWPVSYR